MSYNGIGLSTARGSGTNGFVQKNIGNKESLGQYERRKQQLVEKERQYTKSSKQSKLQKDKDILDHEFKRKIEIRCSTLRDELEEDDSLEDEEIEKRVEALRKQLIEEDEKQKLALERQKKYKSNRYQSISTKRELSPVRDQKSEQEAQDFMNSFKKEEMDY